MTPPSASNTERFLAQPLRFVELDDARIAYREFGSGPPLVLLHGFPLSGLTYRHLVPHLESRFTCYVIDTPGLGESKWRPGMDFHFTAQALRMKACIDAIGLQTYPLLAHDTGATLARLLALADAGRVQRIVLVNTEMPGHRTPWILFYTALFRIPGVTTTLGWILRSRRYLRSRIAFGNLYSDPALLNDDFVRCFISPLVASKPRREGVRRYLLGFDWALLDGLRDRHAEIAVPVLLIWGEDDPTFPIELARAMALQFNPTAPLVRIPAAKLLVHEEKPELVAREVVKFLGV